MGNYLKTNRIKTKRIRKSWMLFDKERINQLSENDWEHYKWGGCLCFAYSPSECLCGSWDNKRR